MGLSYNPCQGCEAYYTRSGMNRHCVLNYTESCKWMEIYKKALGNNKRIEDLESALKVIHTWAAFDIRENYQKALIPEHVVELCDKVLEKKL